MQQNTAQSQEDKQHFSKDAVSNVFRQRDTSAFSCADFVVSTRLCMSSLKRERSKSDSPGPSEGGRERERCDMAPGGRAGPERSYLPFARHKGTVFWPIFRRSMAILPFGVELGNVEEYVFEGCCRI